MKKILKFGGTSVGSMDRIQHVAKIIKKERDAGNKIIVVVSAMSGKTNELIELSKKIGDNFDRIFSYKPGQWLICRDFTRAMRPQWEKFNSSIMRWEAGEHEFIYTNFISIEVR